MTSERVPGQSGNLSYGAKLLRSAKIGRENDRVSCHKDDKNVLFMVGWPCHRLQQKAHRNHFTLAHTCTSDDDVEADDDVNEAFLVSGTSACLLEASKCSDVASNGMDN